MWEYGLDRCGAGQGQVAGTCECGNETGLRKMRGISWLAENLLACQEGLYSMEWVSKWEAYHPTDTVEHFHFFNASPSLRSLLSVQFTAVSKRNQQIRIIVGFYVLLTVYPCIIFFQIKPTRCTLRLSVFISASRMKNQLDVTCYFISLIMRSTCFGH